MSHPWQGVQSRRAKHIGQEIVKYAAIFIDVLAIASTQTAAAFGGHFAGPRNFQDYYVIALAAVCVLNLLFKTARLYEFEVIVGWPRWSGMLLMVTAAVSLIFGALLYLANVGADFPRSWFLTTFIGSACLIWAMRGALAAVVRHQARRGALTRSVAVFGAGLQGKQLVEHLRDETAGGKRVVGVFDDRRTRLEPVPDIPFLGDLKCLEREVRRRNIDEVLIALPWSAENRIVEVTNRLRELPLDVYLGCDLVAYRFPGNEPRLLAGVPVFHIVRVPLTGWRRVVKLLEDKLSAALLLVLMAPIMLAIAVAIRLDTPGPVLFRQQRYGFNNAPIRVLKFRSMHHNPEAHLGFLQARRDDARVTRVGRLLRRTSLDELPQIFNVLEGTMSLVGPRPHPVELHDQFAALVDGYNGRHRVKPGITGWAQVNGWRGETDTIAKMRSRIEHDIFYIENWSLFLDLRILAITALRGCLDRNAY
jgi:polysaccharide biosynthesis protein PslA